MPKVIRLAELTPISIYEKAYALQFPKKKDDVSTTVPEGAVYHNNYLEYLETAWQYHRGIVLTPDIIQYSVLCEVAGLIKESPEAFRHLFTKSAKKVEVTVVSGSLTDMPVDVLVDKLVAAYIPTDVSPYLVDFTTTTARSKLAKCTAFADAVSPYYNYSMFCCGIPFVEVHGTSDDWASLDHNVNLMMGHLGLTSEWATQVTGLTSNLLNAIHSEDVDFFGRWFTAEKCGSGSQFVVNGHFADVFRKKPSFALVGNFASHISTIEYKQLDTNKTYKMRQGLFFSQDDGVTLRPDFGSFVSEVS